MHKNPKTIESKEEGMRIKIKVIQEGINNLNFTLIQLRRWRARMCV